MATTDISSLPSHKRTSSTAENTTTAPSPKRQEKDPEATVSLISNPFQCSQPGQPSQPSYVYIVTSSTFDRSGEETTDIEGVYATIRNANNAVKKLVNELREDGSNEGERSIDDQGLVSWSAYPEGEERDYSVEAKRWVVESEVEECEWRDPWLSDEEDEAEDDGNEVDEKEEDSEQ